MEFRSATAFSDPWTTSGGKAIAFHASTRIRLSLIGKIQDGNKNVVGVNVKAVVVKNRLGPPHRVAEFDIYFDRGIDDYGSWLDVLKENNLVKQSGAWYTMIDETTGEELGYYLDIIKIIDYPAQDDRARYNKRYASVFSFLDLLIQDL